MLFRSGNVSNVVIYNSFYSSNKVNLVGSGKLIIGDVGSADVNVVSEANIDFGASKKASINTEADTALLDAGISALIHADKVIDTFGSPWVLEFRDKDTKNVLLRQEMKNAAGEAITSINNVLGRLELE